MKSTLQIHGNQFKSSGEDTYATKDDFQRLFEREVTDLFRLSLQLTADAEKAERCFIFAMRECIANATVSKRWAAIWARRTVVRNAIRLVLGNGKALSNDIHSETASDFHLQPREYQIETLQDSLAILELPDFDRLAFVICVLVRYSILDCALLLNRSPKDVDDARVRAIKQIVSAEERNHRESPTTSSYGACSHELGVLDDSCGSLFN